MIYRARCMQEAGRPHKKIISPPPMLVEIPAWSVVKGCYMKKKGTLCCSCRRMMPVERERVTETCDEFAAVELALNAGALPFFG